MESAAVKSGLVIDDNTNTKIIVGDILSWTKSLEASSLYIECQLRVCLAYHLSLSLLKSHIFPKHFGFVGIDVCLDGNRPAIYLSINSSNTGLNLRPSVMLPRLLVLCNSIANSFLSLRFELHHFAT